MNETRRVTVGGTAIGDGLPCYVVAEMAWSHDGKLANALRIVEGAAEAGAQAINVHVTSLPDYMIRHYGSGKGRVSAGKEGSPVYTYLESINLSNADWEKVFARARALQLGLSVMVNDRPSLEFAAAHGPDLLMVPSACMGDLAFITDVARRGKPVLISIGGAHLAELERAILAIRGAGNDNVIVQYGFQSYPTQLEDVHLRYLDTLKRTFGVPVSYGDHTDGADELALTVPVVAVALGANVIEKHLTYDRSVKGEDFESALDIADFRRMMRLIRETEKALGRTHWNPLNQREIDYRGVARKRAVAARPLAKGETLTEAMVAYKRSDAGLYPDECRPLFGRPLKEALSTDDPIDWSAVV